MLEPDDTKNTDVVAVDSRMSSLQQLENTNVEGVLAAENYTELQAQLALFNTTQTKKNILRLTRLSGVLDKVDEQLIERLEKRPDQIPTKDIIEIMNAVSGQVERLNNFNAKLAEASKPAITAVNKTEINVNLTPQLTREEKAEVTDVVATLLKQLRQQNNAIQAYPTMLTPENASNNEFQPESIVYRSDDVLNSVNSEEN